MQKQKSYAIFKLIEKTYIKKGFRGWRFTITIRLIEVVMDLTFAFAELEHDALLPIRLGFRKIFTVV